MDRTNKIESIVKIFTGKHIDLSKIVSISDAYFIDHMGRGGWFVGFDIDFQLKDDLTKYIKEVEEIRFGDVLELKMIDGTFVKINDVRTIKDKSKILDVKNLQDKTNTYNMYVNYHYTKRLFTDC